ncbi:MAG: cupin domain-containing protein [Candidatus Acidiferrales bacterium]
MMTEKTTVKEVIEHLKLEPLPVEGGYFRQTYRSDESLPRSALPQRYPSERVFGTAIYYLLSDEPDCFSALHRLPTEEIYHFYLGDSVELLLLHSDGGSERVVLGPEIFGGQQVQFVVPRGVWQGSRLRPGGRWALLGTTMAPGYDASDFEGGERNVLIQRYPQEKDLIWALTRAV